MTLTQTRTQTFVALIEERADTLNKIVSRLRQRRFLIDSLALGPSEEAGLSRLTFTLDGAAHDIQQVVHQISKLVDVVSLEDVTGAGLVSRELALLKVEFSDETYPQVYDIVQQFQGAIVKQGAACLVVEITGTRNDVDSAVALLHPLGLKEVSRTGAVAVRGE